jgi:hypothetical protein
MTEQRRWTLHRVVSPSLGPLGGWSECPKRDPEPASFEHIEVMPVAEHEAAIAEASESHDQNCMEACHLRSERDDLAKMVSELRASVLYEYELKHKYYAERDDLAKRLAKSYAAFSRLEAAHNAALERLTEAEERIVKVQRLWREMDEAGSTLAAQKRFDEIRTTLATERERKGKP